MSLHLGTTYLLHEFAVQNPQLFIRRSIGGIHQRPEVPDLPLSSFCCSREIDGQASASRVGQLVSESGSCKDKLSRLPDRSDCLIAPSWRSQKEFRNNNTTSEDGFQLGRLYGHDRVALHTIARKVTLNHRALISLSLAL
jgi:hypothetical protein